MNKRTVREHMESLGDKEASKAFLNNLDGRYESDEVYSTAYAVMLGVKLNDETKPFWYRVQNELAQTSNLGHFYQA